jgi:hypothetical protein
MNATKFWTAVGEFPPAVVAGHCNPGNPLNQSGSQPVGK